MAVTRLEVYRCIGDVPSEDWDALTAGDVYGRRGWLRAAEEALPAARDPRYFVMYVDDRIRCAAAAYLVARDDTASRLAETLYGRFATLASALRFPPGEALYFAPLMGHGRSVYWQRERATAGAETVSRFLETLAEHPEFRQTPFIFDRIPSGETVLLGALQAAGAQCMPGWPIGVLDSRRDDIDGYLASLGGRGRNVRNKVRREIAAPAKAGVKLRWLQDTAGAAPALFRLLAMTNDKYGGQALSFGPEFLDALSRHHACDTHVCVAESSGGELLGCSLLFTADGAASGPLIGVEDSPLNRTAFTYFNLAFYEPLKVCIERGVGRLYLGGGLLDAKWRRGCVSEDVYACLLPRSRLDRAVLGAWLLLRRHLLRYKTSGGKRKS